MNYSMIVAREGTKDPGYEVEIDYNKQLLDEVFVICGIIKVEVSVISRAEGETDNTYRDLDNSAYHKNRIQ